MNKVVRSYKDLRVYELSYAAALKIHHISAEFPKFELYSLADQMRRGSGAICANIAEGFGKSSSSIPEFKRFLSMAIGSCDEIQVWLDFCKDLNYIQPAQFMDLKDDYHKIAGMLYNLRQNARAKNAA